VPLLAADRGLTTQAGQPGDRVDETDDALYILDRQDLSIVRPLLSVHCDWGDDCTNKGRKPPERFYFPQGLSKVLRITNETLNEPAPPQVAQQVL